MICNKLIASISTGAFIVAAISGFSLAENHVAVPQKRPLLTPPVESDTAKKLQRVPKYQSACPAVLSGIIDVKFLPPIVEGDCGEKSPIALNAINNTGSSGGEGKTKLSSSPKITCGMATAMAEWNSGLNKAAEQIFGSQVALIVSVNGYQCRRRNNLPDGKISEHGFANAIDILGFELKNGDTISIERDWGQPLEEPGIKAKFLRTIHKGACEKFTTVLGPQSNEYHKDHFHFDLGCHGKTCTYKLCE